MKRLLLMALVVGMVATAANAATIGMKWAGTDDQKIFAAPSDTVAVDIILTIYATGPAQEGVSGVGYVNMPVVDGNLIQIGLVADPLGQLDAAGWSWGSGGADGALGDGTQQVAFFAAGSGDLAMTPGEYVIGRQLLHLADDSPIGGENKEIKFDHAFGVDVFNAAGASMLFNLAKSTTYYYAGYPGYVSYSHFGNPGWKQQQDPNPLLLGKIPEPASLALLALGGVAVLRRKR